jgi:hypothetical protein
VKHGFWRRNLRPPELRPEVTLYQPEDPTRFVVAMLALLVQLVFVTAILVFALNSGPSA